MSPSYWECQAFDGDVLKSVCGMFVQLLKSTDVARQMIYVRVFIVAQ